ncbi:methyltransferase domain-containing protein [Streptomyces sp. NPDC097619]|uniref:class I SAM-dependent methyltransferase n=1 Tax=Streptomyces sp. NPDC097619 TaxID=3157228 RepID=UPI003316939F
MTIIENAPADLSGLAEAQKSQVRSVYQEIATEYDERIPGEGVSDDLFTASEHDFVLSKVRAGQKVLDIGCGTGRFTVPMAAAGAEVSGLDISRAMLDVTAGKLAARGLTADLREGDMAHLPFEDASFDVVTSMLALMHIPLGDRQAVFAEIARVLKPGGKLVIGVKNSLFEQFFKGDRFAAVDITDVEAKTLLFTKTRGGKDLTAPWYSFSPQELNSLCATSGMIVTHLRGNSTISAWLADEVLADSGVAGVVRTLEKNLGDVPPFNYLGYHILVEAVKPGR